MNDPAAVRGLTKIFPIPFRRKRSQPCATTQYPAGRDLRDYWDQTARARAPRSRSFSGCSPPPAGRRRFSESIAEKFEVEPRSGFFPRILISTNFSRRRDFAFFGKPGGLTGRKLNQRIDRNSRDNFVAGSSTDGSLLLLEGMLQRIALAQALIHEPRAAILDEPTQKSIRRLMTFRI